jgi:uncharacterized linocin/CFP29 family protein
MAAASPPRGREAMDVLGRDTAPFSGRVWKQIDAAVGAVKTANCTARRFLEIDGPYGLGLTSVSGDDGWLAPDPNGAPPAAWGVRRGIPNPAAMADLDEPLGRGTFLAESPSCAVPLIWSQFVLGVRNIEAFDDDCQPLDVIRATRAARDVALEEERLIYHGNAAGGHPGLLTIQFPAKATFLPAAPQAMIAGLHLAIASLAGRGFPGPYALAVSPQLHTRLHGLIPPSSTVAVEVLRELFAMGIHMVPVIPAAANAPRGVIVTCSQPYVRLVVGQDWTTGYQRTEGVVHRFLILSSLRLEVTEPAAIQVLF